jgi:hypothetical protein
MSLSTENANSIREYRLRRFVAKQLTQHVKKLVLKHRQNKNQRQRIIIFVGSPVDDDEKTLVKLGKKLKKNNVAVDIINFGQEQENEAKLQAFIDAVNSSDNRLGPLKLIFSHLVSIPPGPHLISDVILTSPIIQGEDGPPPGFGGNFEFGVDPSIDPELAMVIIVFSLRLLNYLWKKNEIDWRKLKVCTPISNRLQDPPQFQLKLLSLLLKMKNWQQLWHYPWEFRRMEMLK